MLRKTKSTNKVVDLISCIQVKLYSVGNFLRSSCEKCTAEVCRLMNYPSKQEKKPFAVVFLEKKTFPDDELKERPLNDKATHVDLLLF